MRSIFFCVLISLALCSGFLSGCGKNPQDKLKSQLAGRWKSEMSNLFVSGSAVHTFQSDGTWRCDVEAGNAILGKTNIAVTGTFAVVSESQITLTAVVNGKQEPSKNIQCYFPSPDELTLNEVGGGESVNLKRVQ
jgi:hypothetical protein